MGNADDPGDTWEEKEEEVVKELGEGGYLGTMGPPTALQKPGGVDGRRARGGGRMDGCGELRRWRGGLMGDGRRPLEGVRAGSGSSELGFVAECHLTEIVRENFLLNAEEKNPTIFYSS